ncbi:MAG: adenylate kinase family protein [Candidatus Bathyarchaeia archaeon]
MRAFVLTGTPGTGKTSLSSRLVEAIPLSVIRVNDLAAGERLYSEYDAARDTYVVDLEKTAKRITEIVSALSKRTLIEGHLAHLVTPRKLVGTALVLRCNPVVLGERLRAKGFQPAKVRENMLAELLDVCLVEAIRSYGEKKVAEIDTTRKTPDEVLEEALSVFLEGKRQLYVVDWIAELEAQGALSELLD